MFFVMAPFSVTSLSFMLSTLQRYILIVHNRHDLWLFSVRWQPLVCGLMWLIVTLLSLPYALGDILYQLWPDMCFINTLPEITYFGMVVTVAIPLVSIPFFYAHILVVVRRSAVRVAANNGNASKSNKGTRTALVLFVLYLFFAIGYGPYLIFILSSSFIQMSIRDMMNWLNTMWALLGLISACNPILYCVLFKQFRNTLFSVFYPRAMTTQVMEFTKTNE